MHLNRLRTFVRVVDCASFSGAARTLDVSQSAVSQQVKALETALGATLLLRAPDQVRPTARGQLVYEHARRMLEQWEQLLDQLETAGAADGKLAVGSSTVPSAHVIGPVMYRFRRVRPAVEVSVQVGDSTDVWDWVQNDVVDIGVTGLLRSAPGIEHRPLIQDTIALIAPCSHPWAGRAVAPAELQDAPFLWRERGSGTRQAAEDALRRWGVEPERVPKAGELGSTEAVVSAVEAGLGVSFVSSLAVRPALTLGRICSVEIDAPPIGRLFYLIYKSSRVHDPLLTAFVDCATDDGGDAPQEA